MNPYLELMRPNVVILSVLGVIVGNMVAGLTPTLLPFAVAAVFFICASGNVINDYFDVESDSLNKSERPIPSGRVTRNGAKRYAMVLYSLGLAAAWLVNIWFFLLALFNVLFSYNYAKQPKGGGLVSNLADSWLVASTFLAGGIIKLSLPIPVIVVAIMAFFANASREVFKDIEDMRGDSNTGLSTLPVVFGKIKSRIIAQSLVLIFIIFTISVFLVGFLTLKYFLATIPAGIVFVYASVKKSSKAQKIFKYGMYIGLLSYLVASVI